MRTTRAYLAGFGTAGSLLAGAAVVFVLASAVVSFRGWPQLDDHPSAPALVRATAHANVDQAGPRRVAAVLAAQSAATAASGAASAGARASLTPGATSSSVATIGARRISTLAGPRTTINPVTPSAGSGSPCTSGCGGGPGNGGIGSVVQPTAGALGGTVSGIGASLGSTVSGVASSLAGNVNALSSTLAGTVKQAGQALGSTATGSTGAAGSTLAGAGRAVGALLGTH